MSKNNDSSELINKVCEELRPEIARILNETLSDSKAHTEPAEDTPPPVEAKPVENPESAAMAANIEKILEQVQDFSYKEKINRQLHEELQQYKAGLRKEMISPLLKFIIREYDRTVQQYDFYCKKNEEKRQGELFEKLLKEFNILSLSLLDLLNDYGIVPFTVQDGSDYLPGEHKIVKVIETTTEALDRKVAEFLLCGFTDSETGRLIRQAEINIYKYSK